MSDTWGSTKGRPAMAKRAMLTEAPGQGLRCPWPGGVVRLRCCLEALLEPGAGLSISCLQWCGSTSRQWRQGDRSHPYELGASCPWVLGSQLSSNPRP